MVTPVGIVEAWAWLAGGLIEAGGGVSVGPCGRLKATCGWGTGAAVRGGWTALGSGKEGGPMARSSCTLYHLTSTRSWIKAHKLARFRPGGRLRDLRRRRDDPFQSQFLLLERDCVTRMKPGVCAGICGALTSRNGDFPQLD